MPKPFPSSEDTAAMVERVAPAILELLADGVPRSKATIGRALADRHPKDEVRRALMRLVVTGRVAETGGKYRALASAEGKAGGSATRASPRQGRAGAAHADVLG